MVRVLCVRRHPFAARVVLVSVAMAIGLLAVACGGDDDDAPAATQPASVNSPTQSAPVVGVEDNAFNPSSLTVKAGTKVTWTWEGKNPHSVVGKFDGQDVKSQQLTGAGSFEFTFAKAGTFEYQCGVHGAGMSGKVVIQ